MGFPTSVSSLFTNRKVAGERPIYVRNAGDDNNSGVDEANAVATLPRALELFDLLDGGETRQYLELSSYTATLTEQLYHALPTTSRSAANDLGRAGAFDNGKQDYLGYPIEFYADPILVTAITVTGYTLDTDTGLKVVNVSDTLTPNAHVGQMVIMGPAEWAVIHSNTMNSFTVASGFLTTTGSGGVYRQGCTLTFTTTFGMTLSHLGPVAFNGIKFVGGNVRNYVSIYSYFQMCSFEGFYLQGPGGLAAVWACYFNGGSVSLEGSAVEVHDSVLAGVTFNAHGSGGNGKNTLSYCILDGCNAYGTGNFESTFDIEVENTLIENGTSDGIQKLSPQNCRISDTKIQNCVGNGVAATTGGGVCRLDTVSGSGNGGVGLLLENGAQCESAGTNTVTGTGGDLTVGGSAVSAWTDAKPRTDVGAANPQFCRIYE